MKKLLTILALVAFLTAPVLAEDCVEVDIEVDPELVPGETYYFYAELTNCSDEGGIVYLTISFDYIVGTFEISDVPVYMGAGETFSRSIPFMLPPSAPSGDGSLCVKARIGEYEDNDCVEFTIHNPDWGASQNPFEEKDRKDTRETGAIR